MIEGEEKNTQGFLSQMHLFKCPNPPVDKCATTTLNRAQGKERPLPLALSFSCPFVYQRQCFRVTKVYFEMCILLISKISVHIKFHCRHTPYTKTAFSLVVVHNSSLVGQFSTNSIQWIGCCNVFLLPLLKNNRYILGSWLFLLQCCLKSKWDMRE